MVKTDTAELSLTQESNPFKVSRSIGTLGFFLTLISVSFFAFNLYMINTLYVQGEPPTVEFQNYNMLLYVFLGSGFMVLATVMNWFAYSHAKLHSFIPGFIITLIGAGVAIFGSVVLVYFFNVNFVNYPYF